MSIIVFVFRQRYVVSLHGAAWDMENICSRMLPRSIRGSPFSVAGIRSSCPAIIGVCSLCRLLKEGMSDFFDVFYCFCFSSKVCS